MGLQPIRNPEAALGVSTTWTVTNRPRGEGMSQQPPDRPTEPPEGWGQGQQPPPEGPPGGQGQGWGQQPPGQQGPYGPPPGQQPGWGASGPATATQPPQKRSKGRTFAIGCLSIVALFVVVGIATALFGGGGDDGGSGTATDDPTETTARTRTTEAAGAKIGTPVRDGKFEFTVTKVDCSRSELGDEFTKERAQGKFCVVTTKVKNIGTEAQPLSASDQYAYDSAGKRYSASDDLMIIVNADSPIYEGINPGNTLPAQVVFDVPKNVKLTKIELHDSPFSGGVTVEL